MAGNAHPNYVSPVGAPNDLEWKNSTSYTGVFTQVAQKEDYFRRNKTNYGTCYSHFKMPTSQSCRTLIDAMTLSGFAEAQLLPNAEQSKAVVNDLVFLYSKCQSDKHLLPEIIYSSSDYVTPDIPRSKDVWFMGEPFETKEELKSYCLYVKDLSIGYDKDNPRKGFDLSQIGSLHQSWLEDPDEKDNVPKKAQPPEMPQHDQNFRQPTVKPLSLNEKDWKGARKIKPDGATRGNPEICCDSTISIYGSKYCHYRNLGDNGAAQCLLDATWLKRIPEGALSENLCNLLAMLHAKCGRDVPNEIYFSSTFRHGNKLPKSHNVWFVGVQFDSKEDLENFCRWLKEKHKFDARLLREYYRKFLNRGSEPLLYVPGPKEKSAAPDKTPGGLTKHNYVPIEPGFMSPPRKRKFCGA